MTRVKRGKLALLAFIILGQIACVIFFGMQKCGYHMDELFTYGLSNSYYKPVPDDTEKWLDSSYFRDYLETNSQDKFSYGSVYYNQTQDVHPPLYYFLLHTICSCFPSTFTKWFGIGLNLLFLAGTSAILFFLSRLVLKSEWLALLVTAFWGFSIAAFSIGIFIRMYMMLSFWVALSAYLLTKAALQPDFKKRKRLYIYLGIVAFLGTFTQYFFGIYLVFASICYLFYLHKENRKRDRKAFCLSVFIGMASVVAVFPASLQHIFASSRGQGTMGDLLMPQAFLSRISEYVKILSQNLFGGILLYLLCAALILCIIASLRERKIAKPSSGFGLPLLIFVPAALYFIFVSLAAPFQEIRYVFPVFSLFALVFIGSFAFLLRRCLPKLGADAILSIGAAGILLLGVLTQTVSFEYLNYSSILRQLEPYENQRCLLIASEPWELVGSVQELSKYQATYFHMASSDHFSLPTAQDMGDSETILLYLGKEYNAERSLMQIKRETNWKNKKKICDNDYFNIYLLSK